MTYHWFVPKNGDASPGYDSCPATKAAPLTTLSPAQILNAFRRIPLPASPLTLQPSGGKTIVNFPTIAYTQAPQHLTRSITLLTHTLDFRITATTYTWHWGDGHTTTTTNPGKPYNTKDAKDGTKNAITHRYQTNATFNARLDTTYTATYRIDAGTWRQVDGTVTIPGTPQQLTAHTYTPVLVSK